MATETKVLRLVQSNTTGFANITPRDPLSTEINDASPLPADYIEWHIPSINEGTAYSIDLQASVDYYDSTPTLLGTLPVRAVSTSYNFNQNGMVANVGDFEKFWKCYIPHLDFNLVKKNSIMLYNNDNDLKIFQDSMLII